MEGVAFGVGCFHFGVKKAPPFSFSFDEYLSHVHKTLSSLSSVTHINVDSTTMMDNPADQPVKDPTPNLSKFEGCFPYPMDMSVAFDMHIPFRVQAEVLETEVGMLREVLTCTEDFRVIMHYPFFMPATYVVLKDPKGDPRSPSTAVRLTRALLARDASSEYTRFEFIGPSPFHAELFARCAAPVDPSARGSVHARRTQRQGYDVIEVELQAEGLTVDRMMEMVVDRLDSELSLFYDIIFTHHRQYQEWDDLEETVGKLTTPPWYALARRIGQGQLIASIANELIDFECTLSRDEAYMQRGMRDVYGSGSALLRAYLEDALREGGPFATTQMLRLVEFYEARRTKRFEAVVYLISALMAGGLGAFLTLLAKH